MGTADCVFASAQLGPHACAPQHGEGAHARTQDVEQLCSVCEPGRRVFPAFPLRCPSRQPSFASLTFQFYPPALPPRISPFFALSLSTPSSLLVALLFSARLEEQSHGRQSPHFVTSAVVGLSLTPQHVR